MKKRKKKKPEIFKIPYQAMKKIVRGETVYHKNVAMMDRDLHRLSVLERGMLSDVMESLLKEEGFMELVNRVVENVADRFEAGWGIMTLGNGEVGVVLKEGGEEFVENDPELVNLIRDGKVFTHEESKRPDWVKSDYFAVIPIELDEDTVLLVKLSWDRIDGFPKDRRIFEMLKEKLEKALRDSARLREMFEERYRDHLTGLLNRKALEKDLDSFKDFSVIFVDVNDFKSINDRYGHTTGDEILKRMANVMRESLRSNDRIYRYGGDEFVIILPNTDEESAKSIARRLEKAVERSISIDGNPVGITTGVVYSRNLEHGVIEEADRRMYERKRR